MRWTNSGVTEGDPALPEGVDRSPPMSRRRPNWRGVWRKSASCQERGAELVSQLKTGQRLVSLEGDVWRWDGFVAAATRQPARRGVSPSARGWSISSTSWSRPASMPAPSVRPWKPPKPSSRLPPQPSPPARDAWRAAQREADAARERHAATEREINRHAARKSALTEPTPSRRRPRRGRERA